MLPTGSIDVRNSDGDIAEFSLSHVAWLNCRFSQNVRVTQLMADWAATVG